MKIIDSLKKTMIFKDLDQEGYQLLETALKSRHLEKEEILFNQGDPGNEMYIIEDGIVAIFAPLPGTPSQGQTIREFKAGDSFGEMAIIDGQPRSLSARALTDSTLLALGVNEFHQILNMNSMISTAVMTSLNERIRYTTSFLAEVGQAVKHVSDGDYQVDESMMARTMDQDPSLAILAKDFVEMAAKVKRREETLRTEVARLKIEIDEIKRKKDVAEIVDSDFYKELKEKVRKLREES